MNTKKVGVGVFGIIVGLAIFFLMFYTMSPLMNMEMAWDRLIYAVQCSAFPFLILLLAVFGHICNKQCHDNKAEGDAKNCNKPSSAMCFVAATLVQLFIFFGLIVMISTYLGPAGMRLVPAMETVFCFALVMVWIGHSAHKEDCCHDWKDIFGMSIILFMNACLVVTDIIYFFMSH